MNEGVRLVIADEQILFVEGLKCLLFENLNNIEVVGFAHSGPELVQLCETHSPQVAIFNIRLPEKDGLSVIPELKACTDNIKLVIISEYDNPKFIKSAFQNGVDGYLLKSNSTKDLIACFNDVMEGLTYMGQGVSIGPLHRKETLEYETNWEMEDAFVLKSNLTKREMEILSRIADAKNNKEIAKELFISDQTVGVHRKNIMKKLNVSSTASLIKMAHDYGIIAT